MKYITFFISLFALGWAIQTNHFIRSHSREIIVDAYSKGYADAIRQGNSYQACGKISDWMPMPATEDDEAGTVSMQHLLTVTASFSLPYTQ